jgi:hypothetical protein
MCFYENSPSKGLFSARLKCVISDREYQFKLSMIYYNVDKPQPITSSLFTKN